MANHPHLWIPQCIATRQFVTCVLTKELSRNIGPHFLFTLWEVATKGFLLFDINTWFHKTILSTVCLLPNQPSLSFSLKESVLWKLVEGCESEITGAWGRTIGFWFPKTNLKILVNNGRFTKGERKRRVIRYSEWDWECSSSAHKHSDLVNPLWSFLRDAILFT